MRVIEEANRIITKLWRAGKIQSSTYRIMNYTITAAVDDGMLLHNAITGELIHLEREEMENVSSLPCSYASWMDELIKKHFLVKAETDEKKLVDTLRKALIMLGSSENITDYTILPTTNCNARCFYCYEAGCRHENMSNETADRLVDFMESHNGGKTISIQWFGGEPLVEIRQIDRICRALKERNIPFRSWMTSNAYLFDEKLASRAKQDWNLENVQITLDGTEEVYNKTKAYINPKENPYKRVLDNIGYLIKNKIEVFIRLNMGMHNYDDLSTLIDELGQRFEDKTYLHIYTRIIFDNCGFEPSNFDEDALEMLYDRLDLLDNQVYKYTYASGSAAGELPKLNNYRCKADCPVSVMVVPSGKFTKCDNCVETKYIGSIETGITDMQEVNSYAERALFPECPTCPMYPRCIKLKVCPDNTCSPRVVQGKLNNVMQDMKSCYRDYLSKGHAEEA